MCKQGLNEILGNTTCSSYWVASKFKEKFRFRSIEMHLKTENTLDKTKKNKLKDVFSFSRSRVKVART